MQNRHQARWISKQRLDSLRRSGQLKGIVIDSFNGFIIIEPVGSKQGDREILSAQDAAYELQPAWCLTSISRLGEARRLLGLEAIQEATSLALA